MHFIFNFLSDFSIWPCPALSCCCVSIRRGRCAGKPTCDFVHGFTDRNLKRTLCHRCDSMDRVDMVEISFHVTVCVLRSSITAWLDSVMKASRLHISSYHAITWPWITFNHHHRTRCDISLKRQNLKASDMGRSMSGQIQWTPVPCMQGGKKDVESPVLKERQRCTTFYVQRWPRYALLNVNAIAQGQWRNASWQLPCIV